MMLLLPFLSFLFAVSVVAADPSSERLRPQDFAYGWEIEAGSGGPVFQFDLSEEIYHRVVRSDLGDLGVFNGQGEGVPFGVSHQLSEEQESRSHQEIPFFPIEGHPVEARSGSAIRLKEDASGKVVQVQFPGVPGKQRGGVRAYLLDLKGLGQGLRSLEFDWSTPGSGRVVSVRLEASEDLKEWVTLASGSTLVKLAYRGQQFEQKRLEVSEVRGRFMKLTWEGEASFQLNSVRGEFVSGKVLPASRQWSKVTGNEQFIYDRKSRSPVDRLRWILPDQNMFLRYQVFSAESETGPWTVRATGMAYRLLMDGKEVTSEVVPLSGPSGDRYWKLELEKGGTELTGRLPQLELGFVPHRLMFLARGAGPFQLAFGSAASGAPVSGLASLMADLKNARGGQEVVPSKVVLKGGIKELGGAARLVPAPVVKPLPWKQWALWAVLVLALVGVARMAFKLYREMSLKSQG
jgi:hypothetical protein